MDTVWDSRFPGSDVGACGLCTNILHKAESCIGHIKPKGEEITNLIPLCKTCYDASLGKDMYALLMKLGLPIPYSIYSTCDVVSSINAKWEERLAVEKDKLNKEWEELCQTFYNKQYVEDLITKVNEQSKTIDRLMKHK